MYASTVNVGRNGFSNCARMHVHVECNSMKTTVILTKILLKVKKYKKTSRATSNVGYQTNVVLESASSSALEIFAYNLFIHLFCAQSVYLFCVVIKYFIRACGNKVNSCSQFTLDDIYNITQH